MRKEVINSKIKISNIISKPSGHYFFGYYDVTPWDVSENYILAHHSEFIDRMPGSNDKIEVGFVDLKEESKKFTSIGKTSAWNFQQGARLQWLPTQPNKVIYNVRNKNGFGSVIYNIKDKSQRILKSSIYSLSPEENFALTINYTRIKYNYAGLENKFKDNSAPEDDGIFKVNLDSGEKELILSTNKVARFQNSSFDKIHSKHHLTMPTFNVSGNRFCFLHRFNFKDGGVYTRLLTANPDGSELFLIAEGTLSHFSWFDDNHILIWGRSRSYLTKARKYKFFTLPIFRPILNLLRKQVRGFIRHKIVGDQYLLFKDKDRESKSVGVGILTEDGHPTRFNDTPWLITDTYPDKNHYRSLILYNIEKNKRIDLAKFYSIPNEEHIKKYKGNADWDLSGMRSDLHPRWNRNSDRICIDSVHEGKKQIYVVDISNIVK